MDFLSSKRFVTTALVLLVVLNMVLIGVLWWQNFVTRSYRSVEVTRFYNGGPGGSADLVLNDKQKEAFMRLRKEHFQKSMPTVQKIIDFKKALIAEAVKPAPDKNKLSAIADSIGHRQAFLEKDLALHFHELALLCTPAQRDSLQKFLGNIYAVRFQKMNSWHGRPHRDRVRGRDRDDDTRPRPLPPPPAER
ncbi:MAG: periplasmic heavy metal sensor [Chlorobaculum sp.]|jgi:uncharacterized membrane protein|nr:periplasmic heavy metal sensor [Chlorobaculum sp.]